MLVGIVPRNLKRDPVILELRSDDLGAGTQCRRELQ
jgi:hypothetical protein